MTMRSSCFRNVVLFIKLFPSTCPGNWPFSSPQKQSCLLCDHPVGKNTHTQTLWIVCWKWNQASHAILDCCFILTVAKVAWNKRFSKRFPSAKVSSNAEVTQRTGQKKTETGNIQLLNSAQPISQTCVNSFFSHCGNQFWIGSNFLSAFNSFRHQLIHRINFTHQT